MISHTKEKTEQLSRRRTKTVELIENIKFIGKVERIMLSNIIKSVLKTHHTLRHQRHDFPPQKSKLPAHRDTVPERIMGAVAGNCLTNALGRLPYQILKTERLTPDAFSLARSLGGGGSGAKKSSSLPKLRLRPDWTGVTE